MDAQKNATYFVRNDGKSWALEGKKVHTEMNIQRDGGVLRERMGVPEGSPGGTAGKIHAGGTAGKRTCVSGRNVIYLMN